MVTRTKFTFLIFLLFFFFSASLYAESDIHVFIGRFFPPAVSEEAYEAQAIYQIKWNELSSSSGLAVYKNKLDATEKLVYSPDLFSFYANTNRLSFNFEETVHCSVLYDVSSKFNFLSGAGFSLVTKNDFSFNAKLFYLLKLSKVFSIDRLLIDQEFAFSLLFQHQFNQAFLKYGVSSCDFFYYPKAVAPVWKIGYGYHFTPEFCGEMEINFRYIDMFTLSSYMESAEFKIGVGIKI